MTRTPSGAPIRIAAAPDKKVLPVVFALLNSILINEKGYPVEFYCLSTKLDDQDKALLLDFFCKDPQKKIIFPRINEDLLPNDLPTTDVWPQEMYYRLLLTDILDKEIDRILYLDTDMIVNKEISDFYFSDFEGSLMTVAKDPVFDYTLTLNNPSTKARNDFFRHLRDNEGLNYFCSGMLLMNIAKLREEYSLNRYLEIFDSLRDKAALYDQDLLNYAHRGQVRYVDNTVYGVFTWDSHNKGRTYEDIKNNAAIVHFTAPAKPWTHNAIRYDIEQLWWDYAKGTPYYLTMLENVFFASLHSTFTEDEFNKLKNENEELRSLLSHSMEILKKFTG